MSSLTDANSHKFQTVGTFLFLVKYESPFWSWDTTGLWAVTLPTEFFVYFDKSLTILDDNHFMLLEAELCTSLASSSPESYYQLYFLWHHYSAEILACSLANFHYQYADRHLNLQFMWCSNKWKWTIWQLICYQRKQIDFSLSCLSCYWSWILSYHCHSLWIY